MSFRRTFVTGLFIVLPVLVTVWVISLIFGAVDGTVTPVLTEAVRLITPGQWLANAWVKYIAPLVSVLLAVFIIYIIGLVGGNVLGRQVLRWMESILMHIPVVRGIYSATRQFVDTFSRPGGNAFRSVVMVEFPREGTWSLGLVTGEASGEVAARAKSKLITVFVPTSPNPTGGYVLFVPDDKVVRLEMSVDDAMKIIISGGVLTPETAPVTQTGTAAAGSGGPTARAG